VRRHRLGVAPLARLGEHHVNTAPIHVTAAPLDQAMPGQPVDQAGQRALAQVHGLGQVLGPEQRDVMVARADEPATGAAAGVATVPEFARDSTAA
jgi:hypothetical protein